MKGFTLIETLVAITILTLSIAGPLYSADRAIVAVQNSRSQLTASYLAQEGIEQVRALRDNEYLAVATEANASETAWNNFVGSAITDCRSGNSCTYDPVYEEISQCTGACPRLYLLDDGRYTPRTDQGGTLTIFTRTIELSESVPDRDERVVSAVSWDFHGTPYSVTVSDHLTPWQ